MAHPHKNKKGQVLFGALPFALNAPASPQLGFSRNENKIDLTARAPRGIPPVAPDSISILDFSSFPPSVRHLNDIPNSVIGPPSNIAITPDRRLALIANSLKLDAANPTNWVPESFAHVLDLATAPPRVIGRVTTGRQPSGDQLALTAGQGYGNGIDRDAITVIDLKSKPMRAIDYIPIGAAPESIEISPDGRRLAAVVMSGSNLGPADPNHSRNGGVVLL